MQSSWKDTEIWKRLLGMETDTAVEVRTFLENPLVMEKAETILSKGASSPKDFTLHDAGHSFRVANRMLEVVPIVSKNELSEYDLLMMLLSAYLHDVGMTPEYKKIDSHYKVITTRDKSALTDSELSELQKWLDNENLQINIREDTIEDLQKVNELLTYYARYKHNDWSEEWINTNFQSIVLPHYSKWQNDLINICKSHHYGIEQLLKETYNPKVVNNICCHRRYISICLRIGDVLELDPERTPEVLFRHRNISKQSVAFWLKDQEINVSVNKGEISFYARPSKAYLHKAIEDTVAQIEYEINLCNNLIAQKPLSFINRNLSKNYTWKLSLIEKDIKPFEESYVYIRGSFRPNIKRVLELLGGTELYGEKIVALREILQNSFDAVKERIAYKRLQNGLFNGEWEDKIGDDYIIKLAIEEDEEGTWISVKDQGVGMTKEIIENYFLVSGASQRHQLSELSRRCLNASIPFERTGQFGIGVLSYFMLADKIIIKTKRAQDTDFNESDLIGWEFEISGLQDFGELRKCPIEGPGTEIRLLIKPSMLDFPIDNIEVLLMNYLDKILLKIPCKIEVESKRLNKVLFKASTGWTIKEDLLTKKIIDQKFGNIESHTSEDNKKRSFLDLLLNPGNSEEEKVVTDMSSYKRDFLAKLKWKLIEGYLPNGMGNYRILVPYFMVNKGITFYFFNLSADKSILTSVHNNNESVYSPYFPSTPKYSWKGFSTEIKIIDDNTEESLNQYNYIDTLLISSKFYLEINFTSKLILVSADRKEIGIKKSIFDNLQSFLIERSTQVYEDLVAQNEVSDFQFSNCYFLEHYNKLSTISNKYWFFSNNDNNTISQDVIFEKIQFPFVIWHNEYSNFSFYFKGQNIKESFFKLYFDVGLSMTSINKYCSLKLCFIKETSKTINYKPVLIATDFVSYQTSYVVEHDEVVLAEFPAGWDDLLFMEESNRHSSVRILNKNLKYSSELLKKKHDYDYTLSSYTNNSLEDFKNYYKSNPHYATNLFFELVEAALGRGEDWNKMISGEFEFFKALWEDNFGTSEKKYVYNMESQVIFEISLKSLIQLESNELESIFTPLTSENIITV